MESRAPYGKTDRLSIRVSERDKGTLEAAAALSGVSASHFIVREAMTAAEDVLADQTRFTLDADHWDAFCERLDAEPRDLPTLKRIACEPSPFDV